jgi:hypothetical protein
VAVELEQVPTVCRIVAYTLTAYDADAINKRRADANTHMTEHRARADGSQVHIGNGVSVGEVYPMVIARVWGDPSPGSLVNGQVLLDGSDSFWATSVSAGEGPGHWAWPARS